MEHHGKVKLKKRKESDDVETGSVRRIGDAIIEASWESQIKEIGNGIGVFENIRDRCCTETFAGLHGIFKADRCRHTRPSERSSEIEEEIETPW